MSKKGKMVSKPDCKSTEFALYDGDFHFFRKINIL